jgi:heterodisulfide reductase subunit B
VRYAFFPGCSLESSAAEYKVSAELVAGSLGLDMEEIPDWICCGSTPAHMADELLSIALPSYSLQIAKGMNTDGVLVACASCYSRLRAANRALASDPAKREALAKVLGRPYSGDVPVRHLIEVVLESMDRSDLKEKITQRLTGLRVADYYGCLLVRPPKATGFDDPEDPQALDRIARAVGAEPVEWRYKVECCGAALAFSQADIVRKLAGEILRDAKDSGADMVVVACPLCHSNLDLRQRETEKFLGIDLEVPVLYFTQLLGLALGHSAHSLGLHKHTIDPVPTLKKLGIRT